MGPIDSGDLPSYLCCIAYFGDTSNVLNRDACEQGYTNYAYDGTTCTADLVPINPADPTAVATPISVGVTQEASTCCINGFTDACSQETITYVYSTDCTKTTTVTYSDGSPTSSTDEVVTPD